MHYRPDVATMTLDFFIFVNVIMPDLEPMSVDSTI